MEINGLNPQLNDMLLRGQLSGKKIKELLRLKEIVDRFASERYVPESELADLKKKYGVEPDIITWGDYFQTEVASLYFALNDRDFATIVDTVRYDLISAIKIFTDRSDEFLASVESNGLAVHGKDREEWSEIEEEQAHLYILSRYFQELGLAQSHVSAEDEEWFQTFLGQSRYATG